MQIKAALLIRRDLNGWQRILALGAWVLGVLVLTRTAVVILEIQQFRGQIARLPFRWMAGHAMLIAWGWSAVICGLAIASFFRIRVRLVLLMLLTMLAAVSVVTYLADSCDCSDGLRPRIFEWAQRLTPILAVYAGVLLLLSWHTFLPAGKRTMRTLAGLLTSLVLFGITFLVSGSGSARTSAPPSPGAQLRIYLSATCPHCLKSAPRVRALEDDSILSDVSVFIGANSQSEIDNYFAQAKLEFGYNGLTLNQLRELTPSVPAAELLTRGKVIAQWHDAVPSPQDVQSELSKSGSLVSIHQ